MVPFEQETVPELCDCGRWFQRKHLQKKKKRHVREESQGESAKKIFFAESGTEIASQKERLVAKKGGFLCKTARGEKREKCAYSEWGVSMNDGQPGIPFRRKKEGKDKSNTGGCVFCGKAAKNTDHEHSVQTGIQTNR